MKHDDFGDRMKGYEQVYTAARISPPDYLCVRLDGKNFSKFTKSFKKPFDVRMSDTMIQTTKRLVKETHAAFGYTQSDEISLIYAPSEKGSEYVFGGKVSKINSILASMAAANFNAILGSHILIDELAYFDCRSFAVPSLIEASNVILWRVQDARKNSISALFRWTAGHRAMDGLNQQEMKNYLLAHHNTDWNELPNRYKYGTYIKPLDHLTFLTGDELARIPEKNRPGSSVLVTRTSIETVNIGYFGDYTLEQRMELLK
jgi:tRNA(His) guanylyltransferase